MITRTELLGLKQKDSKHSSRSLETFVRSRKNRV